MCDLYDLYIVLNTKKAKRSNSFTLSEISTNMMKKGVKCFLRYDFFHLIYNKNHYMIYFFYSLYFSGTILFIVALLKLN